MLMQLTLAPIDQFPNLASIMDELQEDDCGVYVEHLKKKSRRHAISVQGPTRNECTSLGADSI